jgi:hypothetical protein
MQDEQWRILLAVRLVVHVFSKMATRKGRFSLYDYLAQWRVRMRIFENLLQKTPKWVRLDAEF